MSNLRREFKASDAVKLLEKMTEDYVAVFASVESSSINTEGENFLKNLSKRGNAVVLYCHKDKRDMILFFIVNNIVKIFPMAYMPPLESLTSLIHVSSQLMYQMVSSCDEAREVYETSTIHPKDVNIKAFLVNDKGEVIEQEELK